MQRVPGETRLAGEKPVDLRQVRGKGVVSPEHPPLLPPANERLNEGEVKVVDERMKVREVLEPIALVREESSQLGIAVESKHSFIHSFIHSLAHLFIH